MISPDAPPPHPITPYALQTPPAPAWPTVNLPPKFPTPHACLTPPVWGSRPPATLGRPRPCTSPPAAPPAAALDLPWPPPPAALTRPRPLRHSEPPRPPARLPRGPSLRLAAAAPAAPAPALAQVRAALRASATPPAPRDTCLRLRDPSLGSCAPLPAPSRGRRASGTRLWHPAPPSPRPLDAATVTAASIGARAHPSQAQAPPPSCLHPWGVLKGAEAVAPTPDGGGGLKIRVSSRVSAAHLGKTYNPCLSFILLICEMGINTSMRALSPWGLLGGQY